MPKAVVDFDFKIHPNLQVDFINNTEGVVDSYLWNFGFLESGIIKTYIGAVPPTITFPNAGTFPVILTATNSFGDALIEKDIVVADEPTLGLSILDLVKVDLLGSVNITGIQEYLGVLIRKWQLYLKDPLNISNDNVFNESVWPNFANILIAKLVIWDLLLVTQRGLLISQDFNAGNNANVLTDYTLQSIPIYSISILSVVMNNLEMAISYPVINDDAGLLAFLNSQGWGTFILDGSIIKSIANTNDLVSLKYNVVGDIQTYTASFSKTNQSITTNSTQTGTRNVRGAVKRIETGPSNAEWYDPTPALKTLIQAGALDNLKEEICSFAQRLGIKFYFCKASKKPHLFIVGNPYNSKCW